jgi:predicted MFS family arabinose efflux permease
VTTRGAWLGVGVISLAVGLLYTAIFTVPPLIAPIFTDEQGLSTSDAGLLMTVYLAVYAAASLPAGALADRVGPARLIAGGLLLAGIATLLFPLTTAFGVQLALRGLLGLAAACVYPPGITLLRRLLPPERAHVGVGWFTAGLSAGITVAYFVTPRLESSVGWKWPFTIFGIACVVAVASLVLIPREGWRSSVGHAEERTPSMLPLLRNPALLAVSAALFLVLGSLYGILTWTPPFLDDVAGFSADEVSNASLLVAFVAIPASLLGGWASARLGRPVLVTVVSLLLVLPVVLFAVVATGQGALLTTLLVVASFGGSAALIPLSALPSLVVEPRLAGTATGFALTAAFGGAILCTYLGGWMVDWWGWDVAFIVFAGLAGVAAVVVGLVLAPRLAAPRAAPALDAP